MFVRVKAHVAVDSSGLLLERPSILTPNGHMDALLNYFLAHMPAKSVGWAIKVRDALLLMLEYVEANPHELNKPVLFENFVLRLYSGTYNPSTGLDESGLGWNPQSTRNVHLIFGRLDEFFNWMGNEDKRALEFNPRVEGSAYDRRCAAVAYQYRRQHALLGHVWPKKVSSEHHRIAAQRPTDFVEELPPSFPEGKLDELLDKGFKVGGVIDHRCCAMTLAMNGAGFRASELFHLYPQDVGPDPLNPEKALLRIFHPIEGAAPSDWVNGAGSQVTGNRAAYLASRFGLPPRNRVLGRASAGWKGSALEGRGLVNGSLKGYWFEPELGEKFMYHWERYLHQLAQVDRAHPYAFVNLDSSSRGEPYKLAEFAKAHARACERIGLQVAKHLGTTLHGHRHAYGQRLHLAGFHPKLIQRFLHHASIDSQNVYTAPSPEEVENELEAGVQRLKAARAAAAT